MCSLADVTRTPLGTDSNIVPSPMCIETWPTFPELMRYVDVG
jgi:hypothetical protein